MRELRAAVQIGMPYLLNHSAAPSFTPLEPILVDRKERVSSLQATAGPTCCSLRGPVPPARGLIEMAIGLDQLKVANAERLREFEQRHYRRVTATSFQARQVLLAVSGELLDLFLRQAFRAPDTAEVSAHQPAHIHAYMDGGLHTLVLRTLVCKPR